MLTPEQQKKAIELFNALKELKANKLTLVSLSGFTNKKMLKKPVMETYFKNYNYAAIIAKEFGVSISTISKALTNAGVIEQTKEILNTELTSGLITEESTIGAFFNCFKTQKLSFIGAVHREDQNEGDDPYWLNVIAVLGENGLPGFFMFTLDDDDGNDKEKLYKPYINVDGRLRSVWIRPYLASGTRILEALKKDGFK